MEKKLGKQEIINNKRRIISAFNIYFIMETNKNILYNIIRGIVFLFILGVIWLIGKDWLKPNLIKALGGYTAKDYKETVDTLSIQRDSFYAKYARLTLKVETIKPAEVIYVPKYIKSTDNNTSIPPKGKQQNLPSDKVEIDSIYRYFQAISDSLIDGNIETIIDPINCKMTSQSLVYTPKFPTIVKETITLEKTKETTLYDKPKAKIGIGINGTTDKKVGGILLYQTPKGIQFQGGIQFNTKDFIPNKNKKEFSVGIIKLF